MIHRTSTSRIALTACAFLWAILVVAGCGGDAPESSIECGEGTDVVDGTCVPVDHDCADGKVVTPVGNCIDPELFCGTGSVYDSGEGRCISAADVRCGDGTVELDGQCRIAPPVACGEGTVLANGECRLTEEVCGPGTELSEAQCLVGEGACSGRAQYDVVTQECVDLDPVECGANTVALDDTCIPQRTLADELAAQSTQTHADGEPLVPSPDNPLIFTGVLSNSTSQSFELEGTEGTWIELTIYSRGLPSPAFDLHDGGDWERSTVAGLQSAPKRTILIPSSGTYELEISTALHGLENADEFGDPSWEYVGVIDVIDPPTPVVVDVFADEEPQPEISGDLHQTLDNLYELDVSHIGGVIIVTPLMLGGDASTVTVEAWSELDTFSERAPLEIGGASFLDVSGLSTIYLHFDAASFWGPDAEFEVMVESSVTLEPGDIVTEEITAEAGQMIFLSHLSNGAASVRGAISLDGEPMHEVEEVLASNRTSYSWSQTRQEFFFAEEAGTYVVEFENTSSDPIESFVSTSRAQDVPVFDVAAEGTSSFEMNLDEEVGPSEWQFVVFDVESAAIIEGEVSVGTGDPEVLIFDNQRNELLRENGPGTSESFVFETIDSGIYIMAFMPYYFNFTSATPLSGGIDVEIDGFGVEPLEPGEIYERTFPDAQGFDVLVGQLNYHSGPAPMVRLVNPQGTVVFEEKSISSGFEIMEVLPGPGDYTLEVEATGDTILLGLEIDVERSTPLAIYNATEQFSESYTGPSLTAGERQYIVYRHQVELATIVEAQVGAGEEVGLKIRSLADRAVVQQSTGEGSVMTGFTGSIGSTYLIEITALTDIDDEFSLHLNGMEVTVMSVTSEPTGGGEVDYNSPVTDTLFISSCDVILEIEVELAIDARYREDVIATLTPPNSDPILLHNGTGGLASGIYATYPFPGDSGLSDAEDLLELIGESGNGTWSLTVEDTWENGANTIYTILEEWTVHLTCAAN